MSKETNRLPRFTVEHDGETYEGEVAEVEQYELTREDHGILTILLNFKGASWGQGLSAMGLGGYHEKEPDAAEKSLDYITRMVDTLGSPGHTGQRVIVFRQGDAGWFGMIKGFATLNNDGTYNEPFWNRMNV